jgi:acyl-CoA synthetase (AMP-forming)/AMP-acid ligase II
MAAGSLRPSAFLSAIQSHDPDSIAVVHSISGRQFTYGALLHDIVAAKQKVLSAIGRKENELAGERVAFLVENSYDYVGMQQHYQCAIPKEWC